MKREEKFKGTQTTQEINYTFHLEVSVLERRKLCLLLCGIDRHVLLFYEFALAVGAAAVFRVVT